VRVIDLPNYLPSVPDAEAVDAYDLDLTQAVERLGVVPAGTPAAPPAGDPRADSTQPEAHNLNAASCLTRSNAVGTPSGSGLQGVQPTGSKAQARYDSTPLVHTMGLPTY
jgi:hypothetical protein